MQKETLLMEGLGHTRYIFKKNIYVCVISLLISSVFFEQKQRRIQLIRTGYSWSNLFNIEKLLVIVNFNEEFYGAILTVLYITLTIQTGSVHITFTFHRFKYFSDSRPNMKVKYPQPLLLCFMEK